MVLKCKEWITHYFNPKNIKLNLNDGLLGMFTKKFCLKLKINRNELILLRGILHTKRMYKG